MKNIFFLLSILLGQVVYCQAQRLGDFLTNLVAPLDKTEISSGFLWDKGTNGLAEPAVFDGILRDSVYLQPQTFGFLYVQARNAFVGSGANPLPHPDTYMDYVDRFTGTDTIPLAAFALQYHRIHKTALDSNLFVLQGEQLFDVPGRPQSPYWKDTMLAFVPLKTDAWHSTVYFTLPTVLLWQNLGWSDPLLQADFDDGQGWLTITAGETYPIQYLTSGAKTIRTRMQEGNTILEGQSILFVAETAVEERGGGPNYPVDTPEDIIPIPGGGGDLRIFYGSPCNKLLKPFILVEGFELVDDPMQFTNRLNNLLVEKIAVISSDPTLPLGEWLYTQGYDIVWVNLFSIQDPIQNNAEVVKAAIQVVNNIKAANGSSEPNMIMGVSAGGVITNYMFRKTNSVPFDHQCEKFFTYDAPLRGANIPVSVQCLLQHINYIASDYGQNILAGNPNIAAAFNALTSPFARQTLIYRFYYPPNPNDSDDGRLDSGEHDAFMAEVDALGPLPIRHIALANGSPDDTNRENISPGSLMFNVNTSGDATVFVFPGPLLFVDIEFNANGFAIPDITNDRIYDGNLKVKLNGFRIKQFPLDVEVDAADKTYDTAPGGSSNLAIFAVNVLNGTPVPNLEVPVLPNGQSIPVAMSPVAVTTYATHYCFVPTRSAIAADDGISINGTFECGLGTSDRCTMNTEPTGLPDNYGVSTPEINQDHVYLDARIGDIIVDEATGANLIPGGLLPDILSTYYNVGLPVQSGIPAITISSSSGKLSINNNGKVAYAAGSEPDAYLNLLRAYTKCEATVTVEQDAQLVIGADDNTRHGVLTILNGSSLHIKPGGTLRVTSNQSALVIREGATLILDPGAHIILESPESQIRIEGKLIYNGDFNFSGLGYFNFDGTHTLEFGPAATHFQLNGAQPFHRCMKLDNSAVLVLPDGIDLLLDNGGVEYHGGSSILLGTGSDATCTNIRFYSLNTGGAPCLLGPAKPGNILIDFCQFEDVEQAVQIYGGLGNNPFLNQNNLTISNSTFANYDIGCDISHRHGVNMLNCNFDGGGIGNAGPYALFSNFNFTTLLRNCTITGHSSNSQVSNLSAFDILTDSEMYQGVSVNGGFLFWMDGGTISNCDIGISNRSTDMLAHPGTTYAPANLILTHMATLEDCLSGISMEGNATQGLVMASCARFKWNMFGISGSDITLLIDPTLMNPNPLFEPLPNTFTKYGLGPGGAQNKYLSICYSLKNPGGSIPATRNFWGLSDGLGGIVADANPPFSFNVRMNPAPGTACTSSHPVIPVSWSPAQTTEPRECEPEEACPTPADCWNDCLLPTDLESTVRSQFQEGLEYVLAEQMGEGYDAFVPVSDLWQPDMTSGYTDNCRTYIQAARSLTEGENFSGEQRFIQKSEARATIKIQPNPSSGMVKIVLPESNCRVRIFNALGHLVYETVASESCQVSTASWNQGLYIVEVKPENATVPERTKLLVQR